MLSRNQGRTGTTDDRLVEVKSKQTWVPRCAFTVNLNIFFISFLEQQNFDILKDRGPSSANFKDTLDKFFFTFWDKF